VKTLLVRAATAFLALLYYICRLAPTRQRVVCISRQSNEDPVDFTLIARELAHRSPPLATVILANKIEGALSYVPVIARQVFYIATSRAVILDSYCIAVSLLGDRITVPVFQIWHALGNMKKFGYTALGTPEGHSESIAKAMHMHEGYDCVVVSSNNFKKDFAAGFNVPEAIVEESPLPRTDLLIDPNYRERQRRLFFTAYPSAAGKKVVVYCPTFRKSAPTNEAEAMRALVDSFDPQHYLLVYMPHPVSRQAIDDPRVLTVPKGDIDPLFSADYIISDYSTVIYEAGLLGTPVFLYAYDWDSYREKRSFNIDLEHDVPTLFTSDAKEIALAISENRFDRKEFEAFVCRNISLPVGKSCTQQLCDLIVARIESV